jgi:hypothetical protein
MTIARYDWKHIRIEYVQGRENGERLLEYPTLEQLALDYSTPPQTVRSRAAREHWTQLRHEFSTVLQQKSQDLTLERLAERVASVNINVFNVASAGIRLLGQQLLRLSQEGEVSLEEHQRIAAALAAYYRVIRLATNLEGA